jgi:hypothetical protein
VVKPVDQVNRESMHFSSVSGARMKSELAVSELGD